MVRMVKPSTPGKKLADLLVSKQGSGKTRRLRRKITAAEVAEAVALLRTCRPDADLVKPDESHALCKAVLDAALAPARTPSPDQNWDLVSVYASLRRVERSDACVELGLTIKVVQPKSEPIPIEQRLAQARNLVRTARQRGDVKLVKAAQRFLGLVEIEKEMMDGKWDSPPPSPPPPMPKPEWVYDPTLGDESLPPPGAD